MTAIQFQSRVENGMIEVPWEYRDQLVGAIRVIVLSQSPSPPQGTIADLLARPIDDPTFKPLPRDEIYSART